MSNSKKSDERSIDFIWSWYEDQREALLDFRNKIRLFLAEFLQDKENINHKKFIGMTPQEFESYFKESNKELDYLVCFDLLSATEAVLRMDYNEKVSLKLKTETARKFREINKEKGNKVSLEEDIIKVWKQYDTSTTSDFSDFLGSLKYRHWLAHGRYWNPKIGRIYTPETVYAIAQKIYEVVKEN
jgi:hypothetical protein